MSEARTRTTAAGMVGAVADDFTGATDVAVAFRRAGLTTLVAFGLPPSRAALPQADAVVIGLKTRTAPVSEAVGRSVAAARWLRDRGADQVYFKYCSTFDSTPEGNIGPVADALADELGAALTVVTPSSPEHLRTQYMGHLFVDAVLLSESHMRHHPLTPMRDARVAALLGAQTARPVTLVRHPTVRAGLDAVAGELDAARDAGVRYAVVDAVSDEDLTTIGSACLEHPLVTGAAGLAGGLGRARAARGGTVAAGPGPVDPVGPAPSVVLAGSCSARTLEQVAVMKAQGFACHQLDAVATPDPEGLAAAALRFYDAQPAGRAPLIYSSLPPEELRRCQDVLGAERSAAILEGAMARIAAGLVARGVRRLVVAGGETSGAVVTALSVEGGLIGAEVAPGVPWIYTTGDAPLALLLKSGNFGDPGLLVRAVTQTAAAPA